MYGLLTLAMLIVGLGFSYGLILYSPKNPKKWNSFQEVWFALLCVFIAGFLGWGAFLTIAKDWLGLGGLFIDWLDQGWGLVILSLPPPVFLYFKTKP